MQTGSANDRKDYWLAGDVKELIGHASLYHDTYASFNTSTIQMAWIRNYFAYYSNLTPPSWDSSFSFLGQQGELVRLYSPKARTYMQQLISVVTKKPLAFQALAESTGTSIMQDVRLANAISEQEIQLQNLNVKRKQLMELCLILGASWTYTRWRKDKGVPHAVYDGQIIYTGGNQIDIKSVFDVYYDTSTNVDWQDIPWAEVLTPMSRWDLMAQYPDMEDAISQLPSWSQVMGTNFYFNQRQRNDDIVGIYEMYGRPGAALGHQGRYTMYGSVDCVLEDGPNICGTIPLEPMMTSRISQTGFGYPMFTDIIPANEMYDNTLSAIASNQSQFGVQDITIPKGAGIDIEQMGGMRYVYFTPQNIPGGGRPEPLNLLATAPEMFTSLEICDANMQALSRLQPIMTGSTEGITSGAMAATLIANALESVDSIGEMLNICMERTMMHCVNNYKKFGQLPNHVTIAGANGQLKKQEFVGDDLTRVSQMKILISNPMQHTVSGRIELANQILQIPKEDRPAFIAILNGAPLEDITKGETTELDLIKLEDDALMEGRPVIALATDDHAQHILSHKSLLNDPEIRLNGDLNQTVLAHILEHLTLSESTDPRLLILSQTGQLPPPGSFGFSEEMQQGSPEGDGQPMQFQEMGGEDTGQVAEPAEPQQDILGRPTAGTEGY